MRASKRTQLVPYDRPDDMSQRQLEIAWLTCIFCKPKQCQKWMLSGLDQSMFEDPNIFEIGRMWLRMEFDSEDEFMPELTEVNCLALKDSGLSVATLVSYFDFMYALPSYYKIYCETIESRHIPTMD